VDGTTVLAPLTPEAAPNATSAVHVSFAFQETADGQFLGFMNSTSWTPLNGTSTLLAVHQDPTSYAPAGVGIGAGDQLLVTEDSIQVLDVQIVRVLTGAGCQCAVFLSDVALFEKDNLDDGDHPFHLHGHRFYMYVWRELKEKDVLIFVCAEWAPAQDAIRGRSSTRQRPSSATPCSYPRTAGSSCASSRITVRVALFLPLSSVTDYAL
jgi:hypothetical protein